MGGSWWSNARGTVWLNEKGRERMEKDSAFVAILDEAMRGRVTIICVGSGDGSVRTDQ